jgi:hypothetical protein
MTAAMGHAIERDADGHAVIRKPVQEVRRAVERVDDGHETVLGIRLVAQFLADDPDVGNARQQHVADALLGPQIDMAHEVGGALGLPLDGAVRAGFVGDEVGGGPGGGGGGVEPVLGVVWHGWKLATGTRKGRVLRGARVGSTADGRRQELTDGSREG